MKTCVELPPYSVQNNIVSEYFQNNSAIISTGVTNIICQFERFQLQQGLQSGPMYTGIFAVAVQFQNRDNFIVFLIKKAGFVFFFEKSKNELVRPKMVFWQF